jgi:hypothetical protein
VKDAQAALETALAEREALEREAEDIRCQMEEDNDRQLQDLHDKSVPESLLFLLIPLAQPKTRRIGRMRCRREGPWPFYPRSFKH